MVRRDEPLYTKQGLREGMNRRADVVRRFLASDRDVLVVSEDGSGHSVETVVDGLNGVIEWNEDLAGRAVVVEHDGQAILLRLGPDGEPVPADRGIDCERVVRIAIHQGFQRLGLPFEACEFEAEELKADLERTIEEMGEQGRLKVKIEDPTCVALLLKGGHRLPYTVPKKRGLSRWVEPIERFIFSEGFEDVLFIDPDTLTLDEELENVAAAVKAMDVSDMLTVDDVGGRVRVRRTRDIADGPAAAVSGNRELPDSAPDRSTFAGYLTKSVLDFDGDSADVMRFGLRQFAEELWGDERRSKLREVDERFGGFGRMIAVMLEKTVAERRLSDRVGVGCYGDWDVRLERPQHLRSSRPSRPLDTPMEERVMSPGQHNSVDEFFRGFWWELQDTESESLRFPFDDYVKWVYLDAWDAHPEWADTGGGMDWVIYQLLSKTIHDWDTSERFVVRYYGRDDIRAELTDGARERRWAAGAISSLLHDHALDGSNALDTTLRDDASQPELLEYELWREIEEREMEDHFEVEVLDERHVRTVYYPTGKSSRPLTQEDEDLHQLVLGVRKWLDSGRPTGSLTVEETGWELAYLCRLMEKAVDGMGEDDRVRVIPATDRVRVQRIDSKSSDTEGAGGDSSGHELRPGELEAPQLFLDTAKEFAESGHPSGVIALDGNPRETLVIGFMVAIRNLELDELVSVVPVPEGVRLERNDMLPPVKEDIPAQLTELVDGFLASKEESATLDVSGGNIPAPILSQFLDEAIRARGLRGFLWAQVDDDGSVSLNRLPSDL